VTCESSIACHITLGDLGLFSIKVRFAGTYQHLIPCAFLTVSKPPELLVPRFALPSCKNQLAGSVAARLQTKY
jgi:hypothetical protein